MPSSSCSSSDDGSDEEEGETGVQKKDDQEEKEEEEVPPVYQDEEEVDLTPPTSEPLSIVTASHCFDAHFHPKKETCLMVAATITGVVEFHKFDFEKRKSKLSRSLRPHEESCRAVRFLTAREGHKEVERLASAGADSVTRVVDVEHGKRLWKGRLKAAGSTLLPHDSNCFFVGDDDGGVAGFDVRQKKATVRYKENEDYISDMAMGKNDISLVTTSVDGMLAVFDIRKSGLPGLIARSDFQEDELLSLAVLNQGQNVVVGSQKGVLCLFKWGDFGDQKSRVKGHPKMAIDSMLKISEEGILTGGSDGKIRTVSLFSQNLGHRFLGIVAEHGDSPIEKLSMSPYEDYYASVSHGQPAVRLWAMDIPLKMLIGMDEVEATAAEPLVDEETAQARKKLKKNQATNEESRARGSFFSDL